MDLNFRASDVRRSVREKQVLFANLSVKANFVSKLLVESVLLLVDLLGKLPASTNRKRQGAAVGVSGGYGSRESACHGRTLAVRIMYIMSYRN